MDEKRRRFEAQLLPHLDAAYNFARWLSRSSVDAEDIVQDAILRAYRSFDGFRGNDAKPWLLAIVRNCFLTTAHQATRRKDVTLPDEAGADDGGAFVDESPDPETIAIRADRSRKLERMIAAMPDEFRDVLILREMEDMSYRDIAQVTGAPIGTVMSRLARARGLLKQSWLTEMEGMHDVMR
jgi:RNA polymerase sigma factor (sigma-70 family)